MVLSVHCALEVTQFRTEALLKDASKNVACMCVVQIEGGRKRQEKSILF